MAQLKQQGADYTSGGEDWGLIPLESCRPLGEKVNEWLVKWRNEREHEEMRSFAFEGYQRDSYIVNAKLPRFGSGEGKR